MQLLIEYQEGKWLLFHELFTDIAKKGQWKTDMGEEGIIAHLDDLLKPNKEYFDKLVLNMENKHESNGKIEWNANEKFASTARYFEYQMLLISKLILGGNAENIKRFQSHSTPWKTSEKSEENSDNDDSVCCCYKRKIMHRNFSQKKKKSRYHGNIR